MAAPPTSDRKRPGVTAGSCEREDNMFASPFAKGGFERDKRARPTSDVRYGKKTQTSAKAYEEGVGTCGKQNA
jgi:hypothetical protein